MSTPRTFVLVHSPLVGPATWRGVAIELTGRGHRAAVPSMLGFESDGRPYWPGFVDRLVASCAMVDGPLTLVAHSGAGPLLPIAVDRLGDRVEAVIFAEASIAPEQGVAELAPEWLRQHLGSLAVDGILPPWSAWWGDDAMTTLIPDARVRAELEADLPSLPLDYFEQTVPVPDGWTSDVRSAFLWFSDVYEGEAADARGRGWPVERLPGTHLHMVTHPAAVADGLLSIGAGTDGGAFA